MNDRKVLARRAVRGAFETRLKANIGRTDPICIYDVAERLGVEVRFHKGNSFGGMYAKASQTILVPTQRPWGRRAFTCAHELGHWFFEHGDKIDELESDDQTDSADPDERLVNIYAGYLLMPLRAIERAFRRRNLNPTNCSSLEFYSVSSQFGVGYETLIQHLCRSLKLISDDRASQLLKTSVKEIKRLVLGNVSGKEQLVISNEFWETVPIDLQVEDRVILPTGVTLEGESATLAGTCALGVVVEARLPGITRVENQAKSWAVFIRVSRKDFTGRSVYRHLEDPDLE